MADQTDNKAAPQETAPNAVPPKKDPAKAAGSINPREKTAFYDAVLKKTAKRKPR